MAIELITTDGIFALDGGEWEVTNNIWLVGDDHEVLVFDAAHVDAPIWLHDADSMLWDVVWPDDSPDRQLAEGGSFKVAGHELGVMHTPGHSPGCCCFYDAGSEVVFTGDTLFCGGPGATGRSYSDEPTIVASIRDRLLALPDDTVVHTGHGESTTMGRQSP